MTRIRFCGRRLPSRPLSPVCTGLPRVEIQLSAPIRCTGRDRPPASRVRAARANPGGPDDVERPRCGQDRHRGRRSGWPAHGRGTARAGLCGRDYPHRGRKQAAVRPARSEEHTSELQSRSDLVCRLLLEKKKKKKQCLTFIKKNERKKNVN